MVDPDKIIYKLENLSMNIDDCIFSDREYFLERSEEIIEKLEELIQQIREV